MIDPLLAQRIPCERGYIPPKPEILLALHELLKDRQPDIIAVADLVSHDVGLASAVLRNVNSAYFGMKRRVSDIRQAAVLLGVGKLSNLVSAYEMRRALSGDSCITHQRFWDEAADVAEVCAWAARLAQSDVPAEDAFAVGLFHDCGIPIMAACFDDYAAFLKVCNNKPGSLAAMEFERYEVSHPLVGYKLTHSWGLPSLICNSVLQHHEKDLWSHVLERKERQVMAILKLADNTVDLHRRGQPSTDWEWHREAACETLGIPPERYDEFAEELLQKWRMDGAA